MLEEFIEQLNNTTTINAGDMIVVEKDPGGAPETMNMLWSDVQDSIVNFQSYQIVPSVASNNLTVAIKDLSGNDATVSKPIKFKVGNTIYSLAGSASIVRNAGTNLFSLGSAELAAKATDLFVYAIGETGASAGLKFGISRVPYGRTVGDFSNIATAQNCLAGTLTNYNSTDPVANIGRFRAQLSAGASYNWSIASQVIVNRPIYETDWLSWTAVGSNLTYGNGTVSGSYQLVGNYLTCIYGLTFGTTTSVSGSPVNVSLPFTPLRVISQSGSLVDAGTASYIGSFDLSTNVVYVRVMNASGTYLTASTEISSTVPHVWANTDVIAFRWFGSLT